MRHEIQGRARALGLLIGSVLLLCAQSQAVVVNESSDIAWPSLLEDRASYNSGCVLVRFMEPLRPMEQDATWSGPRTRRSVQSIVADRLIPGATVERDLGSVIPGLATVRLPEGISVQEAVARFNASRYVVYAEPNYKLKLSYMPMDAWFDSQWALNNTGQSIRIPGVQGQFLAPGLAGADINGPEGWDLMARTDVLGAGKEGDATNIVVAVLDTGIDYNHPDLTPNVWSENYTYSYPDPNFQPNPGDPNAPTEPNILTMDLVGYGWDFVSDPDDNNRIDPNNGPMDENWHGTAVAGIIGATWDNTGMAGVCKKVKLLAVRISDGNDINMDTAVAGFGYALSFGRGSAKSKANVINCSWGTQSWPQSLYGAIQAAQNVTVVATAGNMFDDPNIPAVNMDNRVFYPAGFATTRGARARGADPLGNVISVMATNRSDQRASFSNWGPQTVQIGAPGDSIITTVPVLGTPALTAAGIPAIIGQDSEGVGLVSGTSFAAPHVSGACALALAINKDLIASPVKLRFLLTSSDAVDPVLPGLCTSGGRLNLAKFLRLVLPGKVRLIRGGKAVKDYTGLTPITAAMKDVLAGDTLVADANRFYAEPTIDFKGKALLLRSGKLDTASEGPPSPGNTTIAFYDETQAKTGMAQVADQPTVQFLTNETEAAILRGFTVQGGAPGIKVGGVVLQNNREVVKEASPRIENCNVTKNTVQGGVIFTGGKAVIVDCNVVANQSSGPGGGLYATAGSAIQITTCTIAANLASDGWGGGIALDGGSAEISQCRILNNQAAWQGGGVYLYNTTSPIVDCNVSGNSSQTDGGGVYWDASGAPVDIRHSILSSNRAFQAGGAIGGVNTTGQIKNCLFTDNVSEGYDGGAVYLRASSPQVVHCTFAGNDPCSWQTYGGAIGLEQGSSPQIRDSIFVNNTSAAVSAADAASRPTISYCLFRVNPQGDFRRSGKHYLVTNPAFAGLVNGTGNFSADPMFVRGRLGHYYLSNWAAGQILDAQGRIIDPNVTPGSNPVDANSPALDAGSGLAADLGMDQVSTRTDNEMDAGRVDIGFHYNDPLPVQWYMVVPSLSPKGRAQVSLRPEDEDFFREFSQVLVKVTTSDPAWQFKSWKNTDDDARIDLDPNGVVSSVQWNVVTVLRPTEMEFISIGITLETAYVELRAQVTGVIGIGRIEPPEARRMSVRRGDTVSLSVILDDSAYVVRWSGTDNDYSTLKTITVTMQSRYDGDPSWKTDPRGTQYKEVFAYLFKPRTFVISPGQSIDRAIAEANDWDIIRLTKSIRPYPTVGGFFINKPITIASERPDDPAYVAGTVIEMQQPGPSGGNGIGFIFSGVGPDAVLSGLTVRGFNLGGGNGANGNTAGSPGGTAGSVYGSAVQCVAASPTFRNVVFENCAARGGTGGNGANGDATIVTGGAGGWPGAGAGGAMACLVGSNPTLINCIFRNCQVFGGNGGDGGNGNAPPTAGPGGLAGGWRENPYTHAFYSAAAFDTFSWASGAGGAVYIDSVSSPTFRLCTFENCTSQGGVIGITGQSSGSGGRAEPSLRWRIDSAGGAVYIGGTSANYGILGSAQVSEARFIDCTFRNNAADWNMVGLIEDTFTGWGGAVAISRAVKPLFQNCTFNANSAPLGGAIDANEAEVTIEDSRFTGNQGFHGGALYFDRGITKVLRSQFVSNLADETWADVNYLDPNFLSGPIGAGGAIACKDGTALIQDCLLNLNAAGTSGGGIYLTGTPYLSDGADQGRTNYRLKNCLVTENTSGRDGGGLAVTWSADAELRACTFTKNVATGSGFSSGHGSGLYVSYNSFAELIDCIVWDNTQTRGGSQIAVGSGDPNDPRPSDVRITYSDVGPIPDPNGLTGLDVAFVVDTTGSMYSAIDTTKTGMTQIIQALMAEVLDYRVAIVDYRDYSVDTNYPADYAYHDVLAFETNEPNIVAAVNTLSVDGGGDWEETVFAGLMHCIDPAGLEALLDANDPNLVDANSPGIGAWRMGRTMGRMIILIADAPPKDPEPHSGYTLDAVTAAARQRGISIFPIVTGMGVGMTQVETPAAGLASGTGGLVLTASDPTTVVERIIDAINLALKEPPMIFIEPDTTVAGWDLNAQVWDPCSYNLSIDPLFTAGYFLSQTAADQNETSPCVDAGSVLVTDPNAGYDPALYTTRTDGVGDANTVDMGYHYLKKWIAKLTVTVVDAAGLPVTGPQAHGSVTGGNRYYPIGDVATLVAQPDPNYRPIWSGTDHDSSKALTNTVTMTADKMVTVRFEPIPRYPLTVQVVGGHGTVDPNSGLYYDGTAVTLTASPESGYRVRRWTGSDHDPSWNQNVVTTLVFEGPKTVTVEFEKAVTQVLLVPSQYRTIQAAIDAAGLGDAKVVVSPGVYYVNNSGRLSGTPNQGIDIRGKAVIITSTDPNNPKVVANTIIDCQGTEYCPIRAFHFHSGEGPDTILDGLTIRNGFMRGSMGADGQYGVQTPNPYRLTDGTNETSPPYAENGRASQGDSYGGAILCENGSSPTISKCVITNCNVAGARGGDGAPGQWSFDGILGVLDMESFADADWTYLPPPSATNATPAPATTPNGQWGGNGGRGTGNGYGGAIACVSGSHPRIVQCTLKDNIAQGGLGGRGGRGGTARTPDGQTWNGLASNGGNGGSASGDGIGGGLYADSQSRPLVLNSRFMSNAAIPATGGVGGSAGRGNALPPDQGGPASSGATGIGQSTGSTLGGAAFIDTGSKADFMDCTFSDNKALDVAVTYLLASGEQTRVYRDSRGGAVYCGNGVSVALQGCTFEGNWGGAVCVEGGSPVDINECRFTGNQFMAIHEPNELKYFYTSQGGTLYTNDAWAMDYYALQLTQTLVDPISGGLHVGPGCSSVDIRGTEFNGNATCDNGGALMLESDARLSDCRFGSNEAANSGGAIRALPSSGTGTILNLAFEDCVFAHNQAGKVLIRRDPQVQTTGAEVTNRDGMGGAVNLIDFDATFKDCVFFKNQAKAGGALFLTTGKVRLTGGSIQGNRAIGGSGIDDLAGFDLVGRFGVSHTRDLSQGLDIGGGVVLAVTEAVIENCILADNAVAGVNGHGGAISVYGGSVDQRIKNCLFKGNTASVEGGAVAAQLYASPQITNCTFVDNTAALLGGAVGCDWSSKAVIDNALFQGCNRGAVGEEETGDAQITYSLFNANADGDYGILDLVNETLSVRSVQDKDPTNRTGDPLFVDGPLGRFYLSQIAAGQAADSPALNAGNVLASAAGLDQLSTATSGDLDSGQVDLGYHRVDHRTLPTYTLKTSVVGNGRVEPAQGQYYAGTLVTLTATPEKGWRVAGWSGTMDPTTNAVTNAVLMEADTTVTVTFRQSRNLQAADYRSIQAAIDDAHSGDVVIVPTGTHITATWDIPEVLILDKGITLSGPNPDDPDVVAATVLKNYWLYVTSSDAVVEGLTFTNVSKIRVLGCSPTIRNCRFDQCNQLGGRVGFLPNTDGANGGSVQGGALDIIEGSPLIQNCDFLGCFIVGGPGENGDNGSQNHPYGYDGGWGGLAYGGAVYCGFNSDPVFEHCHFEDNFAQGGNSGDGGNGAVVNNAEYHGGRGGGWEWSESIETGPGTSPYWTFWDGWQYGPYDAQGLPRTSIGNLQGYYKPYWKYSGFGGAVYCENESSPRFLNCTFNNNRTYGGLSGIGGDYPQTPDQRYRVPNRRLRIDNFGGTIYATEGCHLELVNCRIDYGDANTAVEPNAVITPAPASDEATVTTEPSDIYVSYGGGIAVEVDCSVKLTGCSLKGCRSAVGGGIYAWKSRVDMVDTELVACTAYNGGALYTSGCTGSIDGALFTSNRAEYVVQTTRTSDPNDPNTVTVVSGFDPGQVQSQGGGYYGLSSPITITDSIFTGNFATYSGGGLYYSANGQTPATAISFLHNCLVTGNTASRDGGGVSVDWYAKPILSNCTFADNRVNGSFGSGAGMGGGLYVGYESDVQVRDSIFWRNQGVSGSQIAVTGGFDFGARPSRLTLTHTTIGPTYDPNSFPTVKTAATQTQGTGTSASTSVGTQRLIDAETINGQFDAGESRAQVIVTVQDHAALRTATQWGNANSENTLRAEMAKRQQQVLSKIASTDLAVRFRYDNIPAFSCSVTRAGLAALLADPTVNCVEPVREKCIALRQALSLGNATEIRQAYSGKGIAIAIVDSGVDYTHPMLGGGGFPNAKVIGGFDPAMGDNDPIPFVGSDPNHAHGTCCAGISAGTVGEFGDYLGGVAYDAKIYAVKIAVDGERVSLDSDAAARGWDWCVTHRNDNPAYPIKVISNSWGGGLYPTRASADAAESVLALAARVATTAGITVVASAGNDYVVGAIESPAALTNVIAVGALYDTTSQVAPYSDSAPIVDILAPADPVYTTDIVGPRGYNPGDYFARFNGTSSACPFVAGCVASIQSAAWQRLHRYLTPAEVRALLTATGDPVTDPKSGVTTPRVNLGTALAGPWGTPIRVEKGCQLNQFTAAKSVDYLTWDPSWDPASGNLTADPNFIEGYYLAHMASGQAKDSPCIDAGTADVNDPSVALGGTTTGTDGSPDIGLVDLGYHYTRGLTAYRLTSSVVPDPNDGLPHGSIQPAVAVVYEGSATNMVTLRAYPEEGYKVMKWSGTDDDNSTSLVNRVTVTQDTHVTVQFAPAARYAFKLVVKPSQDGRVHGLVKVAVLDPDGEPNTIDVSGGPVFFYDGTMIQLTATPDPKHELTAWKGTNDDASKALVNTAMIRGKDLTVTVEFQAKVVRTLTVPGQYPTIQKALNAANAGDTIVVDPGTYLGADSGSTGYTVTMDKAITLTSRNPDDPCCVAATIIDGYATQNNFHNMGVVFMAGTGRETVLNGFTIQNCGGYAGDSEDGARDVNHPAGYDGGSIGGAGIALDVGASPVIKNCVIRNNSVVGGNAGNGVNADATLNAGRGGWGGFAWGGGVYCSSQSSPIFINCTFEGNWAIGGDGGDGGNGQDNGGLPNWGGNYTPPSQIDIDPNGLTYTVEAQDLWELWGYIGDYRWYSGYGGAVFCDADSQVEFVHCTIRDNHTAGGMSGVGGQQPPVNRNLEPLVAYEIPSYGGGVYCAADATVTFRGCTLENNTASQPQDANDPNHTLDPYLGYGGGVAAESSAIVTFVDCNVVGNTADTGGGVYVADASLTVMDCNLMTNSALRGGGLFGLAGSTTISDCNVLYNRAVNDSNDPNEVQLFGAGGGLMFTDASPVVRGSKITGNVSDGSGGGLYLRGQGSPSVFNCLLTYNQAARDGGAISSNWFAATRVGNCTFTGNLTDGITGVPGHTGLGGAIFCGNESSSTVLDSIFINNQAIQGAEIVVGTGFELDSRPGKVFIAYSDVLLVPNGIFVERGGLYDQGDGMLHSDPLFVSGPLGSFYLSQTSSGQTRTSPCVNAGSDVAGVLGLSKATTSTKGGPDIRHVDMGYHYPILQPCKFCDVIFDGVIQFHDYAVLASQWLRQGCNETNGWCGGADVTFDGAVNPVDLQEMADCWLVSDTLPPMPNPPRWKEQPHRTGSALTSVEMLAETAEDAWGWDVEYRFECVRGSGHSSSWQTSPAYVDSLNRSIEATYRFQVRDALDNETDWSEEVFVGKWNGTCQPPTGAMSLTATEVLVTSITVQGGHLTDPDGVQYRFVISLGTEDVNDSSWIEPDPNLGPDADPTYRFSGLTANTQYSIRYKARDKASALCQPLETAWSDGLSVKTLTSSDRTPPTPNPMAWDPVDDPNAATKYPGWGGQPYIDVVRGQIGIRMTAIAATDPSGPIEYYFGLFKAGIEDKQSSSGWIPQRTWGIVTTYYPGAFGWSFRVKARDAAGNETAWSPAVAPK